MYEYFSLLARTPLTSIPHPPRLSPEPASNLNSMSQASSSAEAPPAKIEKTTVHNHFENKSLTMDLTPLTAAFGAFVRSTRECAFPQLVVSCRGKRMAFGRESLRGMKEDQAKKLFISRFAEERDYTTVDIPATAWFSARTQRIPPAVRFVATFCRGEERREELGPIALDPTSWTENIMNVRSLEIEFSPKTI
ncbi:unnamed protein product [Mycena citricolor]|uniref:Uncharacterized protein n=1 Tax=Mycena citricolor TaxID=2018698 RepID=A0AAD2Q6L0_9AGAR|nr:unnamed protein product [Mycena citricolor]